MTKRKANDPTSQIVADYEKKYDLYRRLAAECERLVRQLLDHRNIRVHSVTSRPKEIVGLLEKLQRSGKDYESLEDITDLAGVRVITHFEDEVELIGGIVRKEFRVIPELSVDKGQLLDPDRFGYVSLHYVAELSVKRTRLGEYEDYKGMRCEIQIRSILQHAWAEIEHDLGYKSASSIPAHLRRRFSRLAALLETGDEEFARIRDDLAAYSAEVAKKIRTPRAGKILLDGVSMAAFIRSDLIVGKLDRAIVKRLGATLADVSDRAAARYAERLKTLGLETIEEVKEALHRREAIIWEQYKKRVPAQENAFRLEKGISVFHFWQVLLAERGDVQFFVDEHMKYHIVMKGDPARQAQKIMSIVLEAETRLGHP